MNVRDILSKLATKPAGNVVKVMDWMLGQAEAHWASEMEKHRQAAGTYQGTSMGEKAAKAYSDAFDSYTTVAVIRQRIQQPVRLVGGTYTSKAAA